MRATIFVTDDEPAIRSALVKRLSRRQHTVTGFESGDALLKGLDREMPDLILLDLKMPGLSGLETLKAIRSKFPQAFVIMLTAYGTVEDAVEAMKLGAYDFVIKTVDLDGLDQVVGRALELLTLRRRVTYEAERQGDEFSMGHLIAESAAMQALVGQVREVAQNPKTTVLLLGETGTGKEFIARVLHHNGQRAAAPFIGVNCTAIPRELFESELFGYERGAFTGAHHRKLGVLDRAEGGTLFLDEIGDLDLAMQAKLLRVLQERKFQRVGGTEEIAADFRLIAATNRDLKKEIVKGTFREDLYFRLNVVSFELPPLRSRVEDIFPLSIKALMRYGKEFGKDIVEIDAEARAILERYAYPGNIRELQNIMERATIFCQGRTLTTGCLPRELQEAISQTVVATTQGDQRSIRLDMTLGKQTLAEVEAAIIEEVLRVADYNKSLAAKYLGVTRFALDRRLRKLESHQPD
ncbi:MAG TPA: sigma-54 dependent transcriptional regulator [Nitrospiraceae bacterium]|jgi:two-component system, NtrC family, response regulator AtoC|nr:sigma-54 dependent transcriptional regulator [Nitrospiraceae bacterium]